MKLLIMKSLEDIECFDCPYDEYRGIFNWLVMTKGRCWVDEIYSESMFYMLCNTETEATLILEEKAHYFDNPPYNLFMIVKPLEGEMLESAILYGLGFKEQAIMLAKVDMFIGSIVASVFTAGQSLWLTAAIITAELAANIGLAYLSYRLSAHNNMGDPVVGAETNSNLFGGVMFTLEQGGIVPLIYGHTFAKGTLICSSITTTQG